MVFVFCLLFADGGGQTRAGGELQSAAMGRRRTARLKEPQTSLWESFRAVARGDRFERKVSCGSPLAGGCGPRSHADCNIHTRQPNPRQKRFREKGVRGDGA